MAVDDLPIQRIKRGNGFSYRYPSGRVIKDQRLLARIKKLVIPPMWKQVQISKDPSADLQATGFDLKGRKQYIYHKKWHESRQQEKFVRLQDFADSLPAFRTRCWQAVKQQGWSRDKTLSLVCLILDSTGLRIGNRAYTAENETFGLTTLRRRHLVEEDGEVNLQFVGKHGKPRCVAIDDEELASLVSESAEAQGYALFRYLDNSKHWHDVHCEDVNEFIHEELGADFTCKDFRTWGASRFGLMSLPEIEQAVMENKRRRWDTTFVKHVAGMLGNTPSVCKQYYLHPKLISALSMDENRREAIHYIDALRSKEKPHLAFIGGAEGYLKKIIAS